MNPFLFYGLAVAAAAVNVVLSMSILQALHKRKVKVGLILFRLLLPWYVHQYGQMTKAESGRAHPLFHAWIISINLAGLFFLLGLAVKYL